MTAGQVLLALEAINKRDALRHVERITEFRIAQTSNDDYKKIMREKREKAKHGK